MSRTPPSAGRYISRQPIPIYAFEKNEGSVSNTFIGRLIYRVPLQLTLRDGAIIRAVRYANKYWPIYEPQTFTEKSQEWVGVKDTLYDHAYENLKLPLQHVYLFDCDTPHGGYDW
jgi:hypothetical protein